MHNFRNVYGLLQDYTDYIPEAVIFMFTLVRKLNPIITIQITTYMIVYEEGVVTYISGFKLTAL
jgi:hypothetical protein